LLSRRRGATIPAMMPSGPPNLAGVLGFTPDELMLNRAGRVSERQLALLRRARRVGARWLVLVGLVLAAFAVVIVVVVAPKLSTKTAGEGSMQTTPIVVGVVAFVVLIMLLSILRTRRSLSRLASGAVLATSGQAQTKVRRLGGNEEDYGGGMRYELTIGSTTFFVGGRGVLAAFAEGAPYRAYYAAGHGRAMNRLLSAEPL
jgi:hypothetical protein